ncbi:MAG: DNA-processing protein DprA [Oligoflexia bacterium]|nr:DNA-processing protein DprA [Oligoflexia bacterium]
MSNFGDCVADMTSLEAERAICFAAACAARSSRSVFLEKFMRGLPASLAAQSARINERMLDEALKCVEKHQAAGMRVVSIGEQAYPPLLRHIPDPPLVLWSKGGDLAALADIPSVAVVGSRNASTASCALARRVGEFLASSGACVISGLAFGVDGEAHAASLGDRHPAVPTVAVLGHGLNEEIYPRAHRRLADRIMENGGVLLSHFAPEASPLPANFLDRNRIIAGLAVLTIVIQAGERSGALATARAAAEAGRDVLVAPGAMGDGDYSGSNRLIRAGAHILTELADIRDLVPDLAPQVELTTGQGEPKLSDLSQQMLGIFKQQGEHTYTNLLTALGCEASQVSLSLMELELAGLVGQAPGDRYVYLHKELP